MLRLLVGLVNSVVLIVLVVVILICWFDIVIVDWRVCLGWCGYRSFWWFCVCVCVVCVGLWFTLAMDIVGDV